MFFLVSRQVEDFFRPRSITNKLRNTSLQVDGDGVLTALSSVNFLNVLSALLSIYCGFIQRQATEHQFQHLIFNYSTSSGRLIRIIHQRACGFINSLC